MEELPRITRMIDKVLEKTLLRLLPRRVTPNVLTIVRLVITPILAVLLWGELYLLGAIVFFIAAITDALDGSLARTKGQITQWGKIVDPIADKLLIAVVAVVLITRYIGGWLAVAVVAIELMIMMNGMYWLKLGHKVEARQIGKLKMVVQVFAILFLLAYAIMGTPMLLNTARHLIYAAIVLALASIVQYASI